MTAAKTPEIDSLPTATVRVAVPGLVTLTGLTVAVMLAPATYAARETLPENPCKDVIVTVEFLFVFPVGGASINTELGLAESEKSGPVTFTMTLVR